MSNYVVNFESNKYGGQQEEFLKQSNEIINLAVKKIQAATLEKKDLVQLFHETLAFFGEARHRIAIAHKTPKAELFGIRRDEKFQSIAYTTPLCGAYYEYNPRVLNVMQTHLKKMNHSLREFHQTELEVKEDKYLGRNFSMEFSILTETVKHMNKYHSYENYIRLCALIGIKPEAPEGEADVKDENGRLLPVCMNKLLSNREAMIVLKKKFPEEYKRLKLYLVILQMRFLAPHKKKSDWALTTLRLEVDGKMYAISQYLTWMYRDFKDDPVERMLNHSISTILHQDPFLIDAMLADIAKIFKKAIEWNGKDLNELMQDVALLEYEFAHSMPHSRGSGAIAEWIETAIFRFHGYHVRYNQKKMVTFEAYVSSLKQFVENYKTMIFLEKVQPQTPEADVKLAAHAPLGNAI